MSFTKDEVQRTASRMSPQLFPYRINVLSPAWLKVIDLPGDGIADIQAVDDGLSVNLITMQHAFHHRGFQELEEALGWIMDALKWLRDTTVVDPIPDDWGLGAAGDAKPGDAAGDGLEDLDDIDIDPVDWDDPEDVQDAFEQTASDLSESLAQLIHEANDEAFKGDDRGYLLIAAAFQAASMSVLTELLPVIIGTSSHNMGAWLPKLTGYDTMSELEVDFPDIATIRAARDRFEETGVTQTTRLRDGETLTIRHDENGDTVFEKGDDNE